MEQVRRGLSKGEDGYELWLRYAPVEDMFLRDAYRAAVGAAVCAPGESATMLAVKAELALAMSSLLDLNVDLYAGPEEALLWVGTAATCPAIAELGLELDALGEEGYCITFVSVLGAQRLVVAAQTDVAVLYGVFGLLRGLATACPIAQLTGVQSPKLQLRMLDHWDNLDGTIERGFAGFSLWDWYKLPNVVSPRYVDYARANASVGINGVALTNVNANALVLSGEYLDKVAALAAVFRPYGVRVYLTARFSAPMEISQMTTADPHAAGVKQWWKRKAREIYEKIPDFGGFVVKANSEGQPGPQDYGRTHADGANLLAEALQPYGGVVVWRAFVYSSEVPDDRAKQAYSEFVALDGQFEPNVLVQVKNGPIDFQPREPIHPLFGAMPKTPLMMEFQLTQEYLGNSTHLVYLGTLFEEVLKTETFHDGVNNGLGSTVARVVDGTLHRYPITGMAAVSNVGSDPNWCGHPFAAANWYAFGRLCWDPDASAEHVAGEWVAQTFCREASCVATVKNVMMRSREAVVRYMTPLGLHHIMAHNHHQGPGPWVDHCRPDWTSTYYHRADALGVGFDRTQSGSAALSQYTQPFQRLYDDCRTCPPELLLWFHHVPWQYVLASGRPLWDELCYTYQQGVNDVRSMRQAWTSVRAQIDDLRFAHVDSLLRVQEREAVWWKDACLSYFQSFHRLPFPADVEPARHTLERYKECRQYYVPGIPERRF